MIVVDASVIVALLLRGPMAFRVEERLFASREMLHAPHPLDAEIAQALRRYAQLGDIDDALYVALAETLEALLLTRDGRMAATASRYVATELL